MSALVIQSRVPSGSLRHRRTAAQEALCLLRPSWSLRPARGHCLRHCRCTLVTHSTVGGEKRLSLDPLAQEWAQQDWSPGRLLTVSSPQQFDDLLDAHQNKLIVLMCKSHSCRPCKMFTRKYLALASRFPEVVMCEVYGDETPDTRKMMMSMQVKVTPTFRMYRHNECVNVVTGTNEKKLMRGVLSQLVPAELVAHEKEIADTLSIDEEEQKEQTVAAALAAAAAAAAAAAGNAPAAASS